jgi:hypothetical protein
VVGLINSGPLGAAEELEPLRPPASTGEVLGATLDEALTRNPTAGLLRAGGRATAEFGAVDEYGRSILEPEPTIPKDAANERYSITGHLSFDHDVPESVARGLYELKRDELERRDVLSRAQGGFVEGAGKLGVGLVATIADPLNVAAGFVPVVGQARYALALARASGIGGRTAYRAAVGAGEGLVGAGLVEPVNLAVAKQEQADYGAVDSLINLTFGGLAGAGLRAGGGAIRDLVKGAPRPAEFRSTSEAGRTAAAVAAAPAEVREGALRGAVAQVAEGRPVDVEAFFHTADAIGGRTVTDHDLARLDELERKLKADDPGLNDMLETLRGRKAQPDLGPTILSELRKFGALKDDGGELAAMDLAKSRPGMVSKNGRSLDDATRHLWELGYFPGEVERPTVDVLLNAIHDELHGQPRYHPDNGAARDHAAALADLDEQLSRLGINPERYSNAEIQAALHGVGPAAERTPRTLADIDREDAAFRELAGGGAGGKGKSGGYSLEKLPPRPLAPDGSGYRGDVYAIRDADGNEVGGARISIEADGKTANVDNVWSGASEADLLNPDAPHPANTLGPRAMRSLMRDFFAQNPGVEGIVGERISGARPMPDGAGATREQALRSAADRAGRPAPVTPDAAEHVAATREQAAAAKAVATVDDVAKLAETHAADFLAEMKKAEALGLLDKGDAAALEAIEAAHARELDKAKAMEEGAACLVARGAI